MRRIETNCTFIPNMRLIFPMRGTLFSVHAADRVYGVQESYAINRDGTADHRYQVLLMPNGNALSGFWTDLGPAENFMIERDGEKRRAPPYLQPILMEHTVDECIHMADIGRMDDYAASLLDRQVEESTLFDEYRRLIEEDMYIVRNRSTFGYGGKTQRTGYSGIAARLQHERLSRA